MIPYGKHVIDQQDIDAVVDVLQNHFLTQGQRVPEFENALSNYCGSRFATAVNSGTSALHIACLAAVVGKGDVVWTSPLSFVASANCALYCGAEVDFIDIDPITRNICSMQLAQKLKQAAESGKLPKAIIVVHYAGLSCDMQAIAELTRQYAITLIEDASHALGATYQGKSVGSCQYSDMAVFSFHPVKGVTTAEGGAVLTNDSRLHRDLCLYAKHGITRDPELMHPEYEEVQAQEPWYYQQIELGYNFRLSDLHAALGISQLKKLDDFISKRKALVQRYANRLSHLPIRLPSETDNSSSAWHIYVIELLEHDRAEVFKQLLERGIGVNVHYIPIHLQPYYRSLGFRPGQYPKAEAFYNLALTLPLYPTLTIDEQDFVINTLFEVLGLNLAVIPARGGSKRIPRKNIKPFAGKPLIAYSIEAAKATGLFDKIIVSTDDDEVKQVATEFGADVPFLRPKALSDDYTGTRPVTNHAIEYCSAHFFEPEFCCCIYATAPFLEAEFLRLGYQKLKAAED